MESDYYDDIGLQILHALHLGAQVLPAVHSLESSLVLHTVKGPAGMRSPGADR